MDLLIAYLFLVVLLPFSVYLVLFFHKKKKKKKQAQGSKNLPPGSNGWPILGENVELAWWGLPKFVSGRMRRYSGDVFQTSLLGEKMMVFCGAQGNKLMLASDAKVVMPWLPLSLKKVLFSSYEKRSYNEVMEALRRYEHDSLRPESLRQYVPVMDAMARQHLARHWSPNPWVKAQPLLSRYIFELACRLFLNVADEERMKKIWDPFAAMRSGLLTLPIDLPGTAFRRGIKAGKMIRSELRRISEARRKELDHDQPQPDLLSKILLSTDDHETVANLFSGLLLASYDSTATALVSLVHFLAQLPHVYQRVRQEQMDIAKSKVPGETLTWEDVEKMKYSWNVAREALRLAPPASGTFREVTSDITHAGFTIYKGTKAFWTPHSSHNNPDYFPDPDTFDPSRFEGTGPAPYTFVPFGAGPRICPGRSYAKLAMLVFMHNLVTTFTVEKVFPDEKLAVNFMVKPTHGLHLRLYPHHTN